MTLLLIALYVRNIFITNKSASRKFRNRFNLGKAVTDLHNSSKFNSRMAREWQKFARSLHRNAFRSMRRRQHVKHFQTRRKISRPFPAENVDASSISTTTVMFYSCLLLRNLCRQTLIYVPADKFR